ncbi:hypothetical protein [Borreliella bavariensis]|uniref:hypothetical protein n=1 Tax=Borreliella bavariensis TaxID=664662 RepID=UPI001C013C21|nr:hypothetical protein [Borreliella bavariensis]
MTSKLPAYIYYTKAPNERTFFTIAMSTLYFRSPHHLGQPEIVIRSARSCSLRGFLAYRVNYHKRTNFTLRDDIYRFFDFTIKNIYSSDTNSIKLKNLNGYLDSETSKTTVHDIGKITKFVNTVLNALQQEP